MLYYYKYTVLIKYICNLFTFYIIPLYPYLIMDEIYSSTVTFMDEIKYFSLDNSILARATNDFFHKDNALSQKDTYSSTKQRIYSYSL